MPYVNPPAGLSEASHGPFAVFSWVKPESPWGRHFLRICLKRIVRRCKRKEFQGSRLDPIEALVSVDFGAEIRYRKFVFKEE
jgi:hypothetical protein